MPRVFVGYDPREDLAYEVCRRSILRHCPDAYVTPLKQDNLRRAGLYRRAFWQDDGQRYDAQDGKPFSTDFSFSRFLTPHLSGFEGWSLFMDCDMFVRSDIGELFDTFPVSSKALGCVKHKYAPTETIKMDGQVQTVYPCTC